MRIGEFARKVQIADVAYEFPPMSEDDGIGDLELLHLELLTSEENWLVRGQRIRDATPVLLCSDGCSYISYADLRACVEANRYAELDAFDSSAVRDLLLDPQVDLDKKVHLLAELWEDEGQDLGYLLDEPTREDYYDWKLGRGYQVVGKWHQLLLPWEARGHEVLLEFSPYPRPPDRQAGPDSSGALIPLPIPHDRIIEGHTSLFEAVLRLGDEQAYFVSVEGRIASWVDVYALCTRPTGQVFLLSLALLLEAETLRLLERTPDAFWWLAPKRQKQAKSWALLHAGAHALSRPELLLSFTTLADRGLLLARLLQEAGTESDKVDAVFSMPRV